MICLFMFEFKLEFESWFEFGFGFWFGFWFSVFNLLFKFISLFAYKLPSSSSIIFPFTSKFISSVLAIKSDLVLTPTPSSVAMKFILPAYIPPNAVESMANSGLCEASDSQLVVDDWQLTVESWELIVDFTLKPLLFLFPFLSIL
mgnify:CR=1 FL=1